MECLAMLPWYEKLSVLLQLAVLFGCGVVIVLHAQRMMKPEER